MRWINVNMFLILKEQITPFEKNIHTYRTFKANHV